MTTYFCRLCGRHPYVEVKPRRYDLAVSRARDLGALLHFAAMRLHER